MISDLASWIQTNIVNNPRVLRSLLALIILIVAVFLMSGKPTKKIPSKRIAGALLFVLAIFRSTSKRIAGALLFVLAIFIFLHANIADLADVFTVLATLVLAGVAVFSFEESRHLRKQYEEREERRRKEEIEREERDRKERLLKDVIAWARNILKCTSEIPMSFPVSEMVSINKAKKKELTDIFNFCNRVNWLERYIALESEGNFMKTIVAVFENNDFNEAIAHTRNKLTEHIKVLTKEVQARPTKKDEYANSKKETDESAKRLNELAGNIMADLASIKS